MNIVAKRKMDIFSQFIFNNIVILGCIFLIPLFAAPAPWVSAKSFKFKHIARATFLLFQR